MKILLKLQYKATNEIISFIIFVDVKIKCMKLYYMSISCFILHLLILKTVYLFILLSCLRHRSPDRGGVDIMFKAVPLSHSFVRSDIVSTISHESLEQF